MGVPERGIGFAMVCSSSGAKADSKRAKRASQSRVAAEYLMDVKSLGRAKVVVLVFASTAC